MWVEPENIFLGMQGEDKFKIIKEIIDKSTIKEDLKSIAWKKVKEREEMQSTSVGNGVGIAHARLENLKEIIVLVGIVPKGVEYEAVDGELVKLVFVVLAGENMEKEYLNVLTNISKRVIPTLSIPA